MSDSSSDPSDSDSSDVDGDSMNDSNKFDYYL